MGRGSIYYGQGGQNTMGKWVFIPWIGGETPWVGGRYTMGIGVDIPWVWGSTYHG
jgi:hypothetical protein